MLIMQYLAIGRKGQVGHIYLSNMTFICSVMLGVFAGQILMSVANPVRKAGLLAIIGIACIIAGKVWGIVVPDNSSFVDKLTGAFCRRIKLYSFSSFLSGY